MITDHSLDVVAITETWHRSADDVSLRRATPNGYSVVGAPRSTGEGGGVDVIYRSFYMCAVIETPRATTFESVRVKLTTAGGAFIMLTVYRRRS